MTNEVEDAIRHIQDTFTNDSFPSCPAQMLMGVTFYKAMLTHPSLMSLTEEEANDIISFLESGEVLELEGGLCDRMNSDGVIVRGFFK